MTEGGKTFDADDEGGRDIGHPSYEAVVPWSQVRSLTNPFVAPYCCQKKADKEGKLESGCKGFCQAADDSVNFTSPALVDQSCEETLKTGKPEEKAGEGNVGVSYSLQLLVVEESTRRRQRDEVKVFHAAFRISGIAPVAIYGKTPNEVEVSPGVKEGGSEAKDEDVEEAAQLPMLPPLLHLPPQLYHVNALTAFPLLKRIELIHSYDFSGFDPP